VNSALPSPALGGVSRFRSLIDSRHMANNLIHVFNKYTATLGDTFLFHFGGVKTAIVSSDPAVMQHVLKTNYENYRKSPIQTKRMRHFIGPGLLTLHGQEWHTQRRLIHRGGFSATRLASMAATMQSSVDDSLEHFDGRARNGAVDIYPEIMQMTFRMVSRSLFSASIKDEDIDYLSRSISAVQAFLVRQVVQPYLDPWFAISGELGRHDAMRDRCYEIVRELIRERRRQPERHDDLLQALMDVVYGDTGKGMSDESIMHESLQLLVAGHETSSNALCWTLYLLATHPAYIDKVRAEYDRAIGDSALQYSDLPKLESATEVVEESLRLYPPFWMVDRVAIDSDRIGDLLVPQGATVVAFIYGAHHSPKYWDNPERFMPERFDKETKKNHTPFAYLPFGGGPRGCVGGNYAMMQMLMILGRLLRRYDCELAPDQKVAARPEVVLRPENGIRMKFTRR